ncbi:anaphase-promoting complex subunit Cut9 [Coemansia spiralis]|uniref:Anaphase-promoting complex subunit Cut9 n=1 Tax=Coemansia spiralis TaxID=417178 RepID=A0A9W8GJ41_9FUNG|nr:anaphase-promoting complex subunit Cut9 [Coemansia spiralis]
MSEVLAHLRALRADCAKGLAWSSALVWAEKAFLLTDDIDDLLWLVDALVTNGQYRQAEEWIVNPLYTSKCLASATGRYLASVIAMRLGRAEDALEVLNIDLSQTVGSLGARRDGAQSSRSRIAHTPTAARGVSGSYAPSMATQRSLLDEIPIISKNSRLDKNARDDAWVAGEPAVSEGVRPLNPRAWMLYMQGAAVVQLSNIGGSETTPSIKALRLRYPESTTGSILPNAHGQSNSARTAIYGTESAKTALGGMGMLVASIWIEALRADARCWEAWSGIREHGLLTCEEELQLVDSLDWATSCGGSKSVGRFFRDYCLASQTTFSLSNAVVEATDRLLSAYPRLSGDPSLRAIQAARLLSLGRARACLEYTVCALEYRRMPDPNTTAIHITALTVLYAKDALFRIAHELAEEFGMSSIKRAEIESADTSSLLGLGAIVGLGAGKGSSASGFYGTPLSTPRMSSVGAAVAGTGRVRAGARGLMVPETPTRAGLNSVFAGGSSAASAMRHPTAASGSFAVVARAVAQSSSAAATAAWRGLWGLPTWTHPGPPVLATYPCALGPAQASSVNAEATISTLGTFTTTNAQSVGSPTQYEFVGASLAWYAIGCYYLVSAARLVLPDVSQHEWALSGVFYRSGLAGPMASQADRSGSVAAMRHSQSLAPDAEHALAEARRWLAKTTLASPRSVVAWIAFAHTFIVAGEWESATRALHTAVGLCGCEGIVHSGGKDGSAAIDPTPQTPKSGGVSAQDMSEVAPLERGSQLAHAPLASLGSVYLRMGDLGMAESCFDASARSLSGYRIKEWLAAWKPQLDLLDNASILEWCVSAQHANCDGPVQLSSMVDPQLLNDVGVLFYNKNQLDSARVFFIIALKALDLNFNIQHKLHSSFNSGSQKSGRRIVSPEFQAFSALYKANLGNTLRKIGCYDSALVCLRAAALNAPASVDILLSEAFTLHLRTMELYSESDPAFEKCLDQAIDSYHRILSIIPGDAVTTDLLALAMELSANIQSLPFFTDDLDIAKELDEPLSAFGFDDYDDENGLPAYDSPPSGAVSDLSLTHQPDEQASGVEYSDDEEMEIVEDTEENSGSESDMAMD